MISPNSVHSAKSNRLGKKRRRRTESNRRRLQRSIEHLESRQLLASLAGEVWADTNSNGVRDTGEAAVIDARVYLDANDDQQFNANEVFTRTDSAGQYAFDVVAAGTHVVRVELLPGQTQSHPLSFYGAEVAVGGNGTDTQLFRMNIAGEVTSLGGITTAPIDGLVETNAGLLIGVNSDTDTIYRVDRMTGVASQLSASTLDIQGGLVHDPATDTVYTVTKVGGNLQLSVVDFASGQLSEPISNVSGIKVLNGGSTFFDFNPITQTAVQQPRQTLSPFASTLDARSDGVIFGLQGSSLNEYAFPAQGSTATTRSTLSQPVAAISFGANDQLFGVSASPSTFHKIDVATGAVTDDVPIRYNGSSISGITGFDIAPDGTHYVVDSTHLYTFDPNTGVATQKPNRALPPFSPIFTSLSVGENGAIYATLFNVDTPLAEINPETGLATRLGDSPTGSPYSSVVATGLISTASGLPGLSASDLAFDPIENRIVGFDDTSDLFFSFDTQGKGSLLGTADRPLNSSSLSYDGTGFVMFDADDSNGQSIVEVNPDTGRIRPNVQASRGVSATALDYSSRDTANRVTVSSSDAVTNLSFGLGGNVNRPAFGEGLYINELVIGPEFENRDTHQAIELRGQPNSTIPQNTYLILVKEDGIAGANQASPGHVQGVFDLSNQVFGANGFLVLLPEGSPYSVDARSTLLQSTAPGFSGLPGNIYTNDDPNSGQISEIIGSTGYFLVQSDTPPAVGADVDTNDDGLADPGGVMEDWNVLDSIALHPFVGRGDQSYADIVFAESGTGTPFDIIRREGVPLIVRQGTDYAGRLGDSVGQEEQDWIVGTALDVSETTEPFQLGLDDGIFGVPIPEPFKARLLDHFGESNFVGGVRGTVRVAPLVQGDAIVEPAANVTVLADTNGNGRQDVFTYRLEPDNFAVGADLTHALPGVTVSTTQPGFNPPTGSTGFKIDAVAESFFNPLGNKIFAHEGIGFFNQDSRHFRASFYRPATSVSIVGVGAAASLQTIMRLDAYDADGNLLGSDTSRVLASGEREPLSLAFSRDIIAYAEAYAVTDAVDVNGILVNGSPFGRLDDFRYSQPEATATTNAFGEYEITNLFPDNYQITFINAPNNRELIGAQTVPISITRYENFLLSPNLIPTTSDLELMVAESTAPGSVIGQVIGSDNDGPVTYSILSGQNFGIEVNPDNGELSVAPNAVLDFESRPSFDLTVGVTDLLGAIATSHVEVNLIDVNETPEIESSVFVISEDATIGSTVGRVLATDQDTQPNDRLLTYTVTGGSGESFFSVDPTNGIIRLTAPNGVDFESTPQLTLNVTVSDNGDVPLSASAVQTFTIANANDAPELVLPSIEIPENTRGVIGTVGVLDEDVGQLHFFNIEGGSGAGFFEIRPNGDVALLPGRVIDFESNTAFQLEVSVIDNGVPTLGDFGVIDIVVQDLNEPPAVSIVSPAVGENAVPGDVVSLIELVDAESAIENYTIALLDELDGELFEIRPIESSDPAMRQLELVVKDGAAFDFESDSTLNLAFQIDDLTGGTESTRVEKTLAVTNQNDAPSVVTTSVTVSEGAVPGADTPLARLRFADVDPNDTLTSEIIGGTGAAAFILDPQTHDLKLADGAILDADVEDPTLTLDVRVTDAGGKSATGTIQVKLNNVNEPPVFNSELGDIALDSGETFEFVFDDDFVQDPEGGDFQISVFDNTGTLPPWIEYDRFTRTLLATPTPNDLGSFSFTLRAFELSTTATNDVVFNINVQNGDQPLTNRRNRLDVDNNKQVVPSDILVVINFLAEFGEIAVNANVPFSGFVDVSGDGRVTPLDILTVIEGLTELSAPTPQGELTAFIGDDHDDPVDEVFAELGNSSLF